MSGNLDKAVEELTKKLSGADIGGSVAFEIEGEGKVVVDSDGVRIADEPTDVTLAADADTFQEILSGSINPTSAFMTGKLRVDGDMGMAMKLASVMS